MCVGSRDRGTLAVGGGGMSKLMEHLFDAILGQSLARITKRRMED